MDPEDFLEQPYNFGECWSIETAAPAYCNAWKNRSREIKVLIRKEGDYTYVHFPKVLFSSREGINTDKCKVIVDLYYPLADKDSMFYISKCRSRNFVGSMQVYDHYAIKDKIVQARIDYDRNWGTLTFIPVNNKIYETDQITLSKNVYDIGILDTTIIIDEEPENTIVDADEDDTMEERDPTISVFPSDINNEEYDEDGIPEGWIKSKVNIDFSCGAIESKHIYKDVIYGKSQDGKKGIIVIPPVLDKIAVGSEYKKFSLALKGFTGIIKFPDGLLSNNGEVIAYKPYNVNSSENFQKMSAMTFFYNDYLHILPNDTDCEFFYTLNSSLIKQREIGLPHTWKIEFNIPSSTPTYTNVRDITGTLSTRPYLNTTYTRTLPVKAHMHVWDGYVLGEAECEYEINNSEGGGSFIAIITLKNLLAPLKRTASLQKDTLHISIDDLRDFYGGVFNDIMTCEGKVKAYNPSTGVVEEMDASATLDGYILNIDPNGASVNQFYSENVNVTENVGIVELAIIISVTPDTIQVEG